MWVTVSSAALAGNHLTIDLLLAAGMFQQISRTTMGCWPWTSIPFVILMSGRAQSDEHKVVFLHMGFHLGRAWDVESRNRPSSYRSASSAMEFLIDSVFRKVKREREPGVMEQGRHGKRKNERNMLIQFQHNSTDRARNLSQSLYLRPTRRQQSRGRLERDTRCVINHQDTSSSTFSSMVSQRELSNARQSTSKSRRV